MKQPVSRHSFRRAHGFLGVYLQEGAPLTDALWNESVDTSASLTRELARAVGARGTTGTELFVTPVLVPEGEVGVVTRLQYRGGPGSYFCDGIPVLWPVDLRHPEQSCLCESARLWSEPSCIVLPKHVDDGEAGLGDDMHDQPGEVLVEPFDPSGPLRQPVFVWLETRVVELDEVDAAWLRDPAIQSERGSFRKAVRACVRRGFASDLPRTLAAKLRSNERVHELAPELDEVPAPRPSNVKLSTQGVYGGEHNARVHVELVRASGCFDDLYTPLVEVLWDDRGASTVTRLITAAKEGDTNLEVQSTDGFAPGDYIRVEVDGVNGPIYEITRIEDQVLSIRRTPCEHVQSLGEFVIKRYCVEKGDCPLAITLAGTGHVEVGDFVTDLTVGKGLDPIEGARQLWKVIGSSPTDAGETKYCLEPHSGLVEGLDPWGEGVSLLQGASVHEICLEVENRDCWRPGMRVLITGKRRPQVERPDPCERARQIDVEGSGDCWPVSERLYMEEVRTITWIERCDRKHECCDEEHEAMTLRLDNPLAADHSKCCDTVHPERVVKIRRFAGRSCRVKLQPIWPCCEDTGGVCCMQPSLTVAGGLEVVLSYRGGTTPCFDSDAVWTFIARAGGWYESLVFAKPEPPQRGICPLAIVTDAKSENRQILDLRAVPAAADQTGLLESIRGASEELAGDFTGESSDTLFDAAQLASLPRYQTNVWWSGRVQPGLAELLYRFASMYLKTYHGDGGDDVPVKPLKLAKHQLLAVAIRALAAATVETRAHRSLSDRELSRISNALERAARIAAATLAGCCAEQLDDAPLVWPGDVDYDAPDLRPLRPPSRLPECPDEARPLGDGCDDDEPEWRPLPAHSADDVGVAPEPLDGGISDLVVEDPPEPEAPPVLGVETSIELADASWALIDGGIEDVIGSPEFGDIDLDERPSRVEEPNAEIEVRPTENVDDAILVVPTDREATSGEELPVAEDGSTAEESGSRVALASLSPVTENVSNRVDGNLAEGEGEPAVRVAGETSRAVSDIAETADSVGPAASSVRAGDGGGHDESAVSSEGITPDDHGEPTVSGEATLDDSDRAEPTVSSGGGITRGDVTASALTVDSEDGGIAEAIESEGAPAPMISNEGATDDGGRDEPIASGEATLGDGRRAEPAVSSGTDLERSDVSDPAPTVESGDSGIAEVIDSEGESAPGVEGIAPSEPAPSESALLEEAPELGTPSEVSDGRTPPDEAGTTGAPEGADVQPSTLDASPVAEEIAKPATVATSAAAALHEATTGETDEALAEAETESQIVPVPPPPVPEDESSTAVRESELELGLRIREPLVGAADSANDSVTDAGGIDFLDIPTEKLAYLQELNPSTARWIVGQRPTIRDVYHSDSRGPVQKIVISSVRELVASLRNLAEKFTTAVSDRRRAKLEEEATRVWGAALPKTPRPALTVLARSLPAPLPEQDEEDAK